MSIFIGADFHRAMVATAPGEKLPMVHRPEMNWTRRTISSLSCAENYICSQENQQKLLPAELHFLTPICIKSFVGSASPQTPLGELIDSAPPDPLAVFKGSTSKGRVGEVRGREGERRGRVEGDGASWSFALGRKKERGCLRIFYCMNL